MKQTSHKAYKSKEDVKKPMTTTPPVKGKAICHLCGEPMPEGEEMFNYHGYSGDCPKGLKPTPSPHPEAWEDLKKQAEDMMECQIPLRVCSKCNPVLLIEEVRKFTRSEVVEEIQSLLPSRLDPVSKEDIFETMDKVFADLRLKIEGEI